MRKFLAVFVALLLVTVGFILSRPSVGDLAYFFSVDSRDAVLAIKYFGFNPVWPSDNSPGADHTVDVDIGRYDYARLLREQKTRARESVNSQRAQFEADAYVYHQGVSGPAHIKLMGVMSDHARSNPASMIIKMRRGSVFRGMRKFSLMDPDARGTYLEHVTHRIARHLGLIALQTDYLYLNTNGTGNGWVFLEERPDNKTLLENNQKIDGFVFRLELAVQRGFLATSSVSQLQLKHHYQPNWFGDDQINALTTALKKWLDGSIASSEIFALDRWASVIALAEVSQSNHPLMLNNINLYLNPRTGKIEPFGREWDTASQIDRQSVLNLAEMDTQTSFFYDRLMRDNAMLDLVEAMIDRLSSTDFIRGFFASDTDNLHSSLHRYYQAKPFTGDWLQIAEDHYSTLDFRSHYPKPYIVNASRKSVRICWPSSMPVESPTLVNTFLSTAVQLTPIAGDALCPQFFEANDLDFRATSTLTQTIVGHQSRSVRNNSWFEFDDPNDSDNEFVVLPVLPWPYSSQPRNAATAHCQHADTYRTIRCPSGFNLSETTMSIGPGHVVIDQPITVRAEDGVRIVAGTNLSFQQSGNLRINGDLTMMGSITQPITIRDGTVSVVGTYTNRAQVHINNVIIDGNRPTQAGLATWSGGINLILSSVTLSDVTVTNALGEDAINIVDSTVWATNVTVLDSFGDGIDIDNSRINLSAISISHSGGDGIDIGMSDGTIANLTSTLAADKCVSIGERSNISITNTKIGQCPIGIASKDSSLVHLFAPATFGTSTTPVAVYRKKKHYGGGILRQANTITSDTARYYVDQFSHFETFSPSIPEQH